MSRAILFQDSGIEWWPRWLSNIFKVSIRFTPLKPLIWKKGKERKGCDVWPSMVTHTRNLCSAFNPSNCTHTAVKSENTHAAVPGEQLGVRCLVQGVSPQSWYWGWRERLHSLPPPTIPAVPETRTRNLWVTNLTLYPLGHDYPNMVSKELEYGAYFLFCLELDPLLLFGSE